FILVFLFFFSRRRRHTRSKRDWSSDVCSSDLQFNQDVSAAKRQAVQGPVVITDRGEPAFVLVSIADYEAMRDKRCLIDVLQMDEDIEFEPVVSRALPRGADL